MLRLRSGVRRSGLGLQMVPVGRGGGVLKQGGGHFKPAGRAPPSAPRSRSDMRPGSCSVACVRACGSASTCREIAGGRREGRGGRSWEVGRDGTEPLPLVEPAALLRLVEERPYIPGEARPCPISPGEESAGITCGGCQGPGQATARARARSEARSEARVRVRERGESRAKRAPSAAGASAGPAAASHTPTRRGKRP